uniref:MG3 domain-containing protein n=1 Tax=Panagrellus redivivus TaxID=6233 RepID=A0A7E4W4Q7_PANRE
MPNILINYDDHRLVYHVHDTFPPWHKTYEVIVGAAPTVDVFFKSDTQEIRIKTFKFASQKERRVAITVAVDDDNTVTAKLVTLEVDDIDKDGTKKDGMIVTLDLNGLTVAYTRTSERQICPMASHSGATGEQLDAAAAAAMAAVPPSQAAAVYILPYTANYNYAARKRMVQALESAGYKNIGCIEQKSPLLSTALKLAKLTNQVGDYVGVGEVGGVHVVRKTDHGYDYVQLVVCMKRLRRLYPTIKEVICYSVFDPTDNEAKKSQQQYHPLSVKSVTIGCLFLIPYMWNKNDGGNMDGYLVTMTVQCKFRINYKGKNTVLDARAEMLPWQKTVELNIGDAMTLDVFMRHEDRCVQGEDHIKQFKFPSKKNRKVFISIAIDDARLPIVKLTTL